MSRRMKKKLLLTFLFLGLVVLAVGGWTVQAVRRATSGGRGELAPAR